MQSQIGLGSSLDDTIDDEIEERNKKRQFDLL